MSASQVPNEQSRQAGVPPGGRPARGKGKRASRFTRRSLGGGVLVVTLAAVLALAGCAGSSGSTAVMPSIAGTWVGIGTVSNGTGTGPLAYYLDLTTGANHQISGTGQGCTHGPDRIFIAHLTISGAPGSAQGDYTMDFKTPDLGPGERILHVSAHVSGSQMTFSGVDTATTPAGTSQATLMHGSMNDFNTMCTSLPTPVLTP